ncbi:unnamed protein product [Leptidea sinapis]|uniref:HTH psq-type domain-containing protein n=1 Tax=Leptidea sinapis TaxID=189913 RepID=A0A5E4QRN1_9NEOP|nr:unnamed protein product [Leptidea sinapis]
MIAEKKKLIEKVKESEKKSDVAKEFKIPLSTLSTIIKHKIISSLEKKVCHCVGKAYAEILSDK